MSEENKCICEYCLEIVESVGWHRSDLFLCDSCFIGQKPDLVPDPTPEQSVLLAKQRAEFNAWYRENFK